MAVVGVPSSNLFKYGPNIGPLKKSFVILYKNSFKMLKTFYLTKRKRCDIMIIENKKKGFDINEKKM